MPDDLEGPIEIAILDGGDVRQIVVALGRVVVQPVHQLSDAAPLDEHRRLAPHDVDALDVVAEALAERRGARVLGSALIGYDAWRGRRRDLDAFGVTRDDRKELIAHSPDRV
jgi:hypothetical protein